MIWISHEEAVEADVREELLDRAMGPCRQLKPSALLRAGRTPVQGLSLVAHSEQGLVGSVRLWHIRAGDAGPALLLGPLAVAPEYQGIGIGSALVTNAVANADELGHRAILLVGDEPYYGRFGFRPTRTGRLNMPAPVLRSRLLSLELQPGALADASGQVTAISQPVAPTAVELEPLPLAA